MREFIATPAPARAGAIVYSIVVSCKRRSIDPVAYLRDVLSQLPVLGPDANVDHLLPANWKALVEIELPAESPSKS